MVFLNEKKYILILFNFDFAYLWHSYERYNVLLHNFHSMGNLEEGAFQTFIAGLWFSLTNSYLYLYAIRVLGDRSLQKDLAWF